MTLNSPPIRVVMKAPGEGYVGINDAYLAVTWGTTCEVPCPSAGQASQAWEGVLWGRTGRAPEGASRVLPRLEAGPSFAAQGTFPVAFRLGSVVPWQLQVLVAP